MGFLSSVAKVVGIAAAPFTGGSSLALTAAAYGSDAAAKNAQAAGAGLTAAKTQAQVELEVAQINAANADKDRALQEKALEAQTALEKENLFFQQQNLKALMEQQKEEQVSAAVNSPAERLMSSPDMTPLIIAAIIGLIIFKMKGK